ncbi:MAG: hypothetical protein IJV36_08300 [Prevotella sp.]|nr:hypothetical protein [Prevotella sp.]
MAHVAQAKDIKVVIKGHPTTPIGSTEVFVGKNSDADTITVVPGKNATFLTISLKGLDGEVLSSYVLPVGASGAFNIITPELPEGFVLEVKDNNGVVYTGIEDEE